MNFNRRLKLIRRCKLRRTLGFESLEGRTLLAGDPILSLQPLIISEFVADSSSTLFTRTRSSELAPFEGAATSPDWIEILNVSRQRLDIGGLHLTDVAAVPTKWTIPAGTSVEAGAFLIVFASESDITDPALDENGFLHTNFRLNDDGEYLALTNRDGSVIHEFSPMFPAQRVDVSYSIPMEVRELLGPQSPLEYLVPIDDSREPRWRSPGFTEPNLIRSAAGSPIGFDRGGGAAEPGETIGAELVDRASADFSRGSIAVLKSMPFTAAGRVAEWSFYSKTNRAITPLVLRTAGAEFEIVGVGRTRASDGLGKQSFAFDLRSGSDVVEPTGYFFGFKDGDNQTNDAGVVGWTRSDSDLVRRYNGPQSGNLVVGKQLSGGTDAGRAYSVQVTTQARLEGPINTNVESAMANATSLYVRLPFVFERLELLKAFSLNVRYDDGFVAYLNGTEVARRNVPATVHFDSTAVMNRPIQNANRFEEINISQFIGTLAEGQNVLALHGFNEHNASSEFLIDARLVGTDIRSAAGVGFAPDPTPGLANGIIYRAFVGAPSFSRTRGFYDQPVALNLSTPGTPEAAIYFTKDGSDPTPDNPQAILYRQPVEIAGTTFLRAASFRDGLLPSLPQTHTYLFPADVVTQSTLQPAITQDPVWGPQLTNALTALPTISLVTDESISVEGEVGTSVELILPDGTDGFQVVAGVESFGGVSLAFPKRSMRLSFKNSYGPSILNYDLFDDPDGVTQFDQILLKSGAHDSLFFAGATPTFGGGNYIRNRWAADRQLEMGQAAARSRFVQLYLNGVYWGQYDLSERPNAAFMTTHFGGDPSEYDVLNAGSPVDGDDEAWKALIDSLDDGYDVVQRHLDVINYADYLLLQFMGGNTVDWWPDRNWMAARRREPDAGFQFFAWDSDYILRQREADIVNLGGPGSLWILNGGVQQYPEFRRLLADRAEQYFFGDGMFTAERLRSDIDALAEEIRVSVIAESARWGSGRYTPATWEAAIDWMKETLAPDVGPSRAEIVIEQMRQAGSFPLSETPRFFSDGRPLPGDELNPGTELTMTAPEGIIYYTLDGSDPWENTPTVAYTTLISESAPARVSIPRDDALQSTWIEPDFDDSGWIRGENGIGYDTTAGFAPLIRLNVQEQMKDVNATAYLRMPFRVDDPTQFDTLEFSLRYDDGFVAYLNGIEVARRNAPAALTWKSVAAVVRPNVNATEFETFNLSRLKHLLRPGENVLAIHGLNTEAANVDFLLTPVLRAGAVRNTGVSPTALRYSDPITVPRDARIKARTVWGNQWSPLREAIATTQLFPLRISEIMYHPSDPAVSEQSAGFVDASDFEFIELVNISNSTIDLSDVQFLQTTVGGQTEGIAFAFADGAIRQLAAGQRVLVVENQSAFEFRYGNQLPVAGQWSGGLSNNSERITVSVGNQILQQFAYDDEWYTATDGDGASLEIIDVISPALDGWNDRTSWRPSVVAGGTPGGAASVNILGDSNHDGVFNSSDLVAVFQAGEYEDGLFGNSTLEEGDWSGDGDFTTADLVLVFQHGNYVAAAVPLKLRATDRTVPT